MRGCGAVKWLPVIAGVIMYFISTRLCDLTVWITLFSAPFAVKQAAAVELICIFEETGRWLAMKYPLFNIRSSRSAVCYGIGHAGLECWMRGISTFGLIGTGNRLNREGLSSFIEGKTPQAADAAMKELQMLTDKGIINGIADSIEVITNFGFHIALSLLIFKKNGRAEVQEALAAARHRSSLCAELHIMGDFIKRYPASQQHFRDHNRCRHNHFGLQTDRWQKRHRRDTISNGHIKKPLS